MYDNLASIGSGQDGSQQGVTGEETLEGSKEKRAANRVAKERRSTGQRNMAS